MAARRSSTSSNSSDESGVFVGTPTSSSSEAVTAPESFVLPSRPKPTQPTDDASANKATDNISTGKKKRPDKRTRAAMAAEASQAAQAAEAAKKAEQVKKTKKAKKPAEPVIEVPATKPINNTTSSPYWDAFPSFKHDRKAPLSGQFDKLAAHMQWKKKKTDEYNDQRIECFAAEYRHFFHPDGWTEGGKIEQQTWNDADHP